MPQRPAAPSQATDLPIAAISEGQRMVFATPEDLDRAWQLGIFYLRAPASLDLEGARAFGHELIATDSPYRQTPQYGDLEGFIALELSLIHI